MRARAGLLRQKQAPSTGVLLQRQRDRSGRAGTAPRLEAALARALLRPLSVAGSSDDPRSDDATQER